MSTRNKLARGRAVSALLTSLAVVALGAASEAPDAGASEAAAESAATEQAQAITQGTPSPFTADYFAIFYGPSLQTMNSYQPTPNGIPDPARPVLMKNFVDLNYNVSSDVGISANAFWLWVPVQGQDLELQDPFLKVSDYSVISEGPFNLYADIRWHIAATDVSRANDLKAGFQTVQVATYAIPDTSLTLALYGSQRANVFGPNGSGNDFELYVGPNVSLQLSDAFALTLLYEANYIHVYGDPPGLLHEYGTDLEPGFDWDISENVSINPYLNVLTSGTEAFRDTSFGFIFNWKML